jgi:glycosyltransferase involved in cell wall biosynthesis
MAEGVARTGYSPERITVVPNACDLEMFARNSIRCRLLDELQPALGSRPVVLYCGTLGYINGLSYLVHVAEHTREIAPEIAFLVVGSGAEYQKVREQASTRGVLDRNFFMRPSVPKQEVPSLFERASVTMSTVIDVPALWDNSANKFFDSLAAGRPIVINHGGWQADILRRSGAGFAIPVQDPKAAARQLADFTRDPSRLDLASKAARRLAIDEFDRDRLVRRLISIVESVCGKPDTAAQ